MATVYLILGSNMGNRAELLNIAKNCLGEQAGVITRQSAIYESDPWGFTHETKFLNQVITTETSLPPQLLLETIKTIENNLGRVKGKERYTARTIDIDILFFDRLILASPALNIPHPEMQNRRFVLLPLAELAPNFVHPLLGLTICQMLANCGDKGGVTRL